MQGASLTASAIITFAETLEEDSAKFYERLASKHLQNADLFLSFSKQCKSDKKLIVLTYRETITDALEACFSFEGVVLPEISLAEIGTETTFSQDLMIAIEFERIAVSFYTNMLNCSKALLSTISKSFEKVSERREKRRQQMETLLDNLHSKNR